MKGAAPEHTGAALSQVCAGVDFELLSNSLTFECQNPQLPPSVPALGVEPVDGITRVNPEGLTAATGEWAQAFADKLSTLNLKMNVVTPEQYRPGDLYSCPR